MDEDCDGESNNGIFYILQTVSIFLEIQNISYFVFVISYVAKYNIDITSIREEHIEVICNTKYLGVQIDENLTWKHQIKSVTEKVFRAIGFLKFAKHFLPLAIVKNLYTSIVEPHFQYCCSVSGCCNSTDILQLQRLQNRAARIVTNSQFDAPSKPLIQSLGWKTIQELINR